MRKLIVTLSSFLVLAGTALAQPTTQPNDPPRDGPPERRDGMFRGDGTGFRRGMRDGWRGRGITEEEWSEVSAFVKKEFPNRWAMFEKMSADKNKPGLVNDMKQRITERYRMLMRAQTATPELYDTLLGQAKLEDNVFGAVRAVRDAPDDQKDSAMSALRQAVSELVKSGLEERAKHLAEAEKTLAEHKARLAKDLAERDALIDAQVERFLSENPFRGPPDAPLPGTGIRPVREGPRDGPDGPRGDGPRGDGPRGDGPRDGPREGPRDRPREGPPGEGPPPPGEGR